MGRYTPSFPYLQARLVSESAIRARQALVRLLIAIRHLPDRKPHDGCTDLFPYNPVLQESRLSTTVSNCGHLKHVTNVSITAPNTWRPPYVLSTCFDNKVMAVEESEARSVKDWTAS